MKDFLAAGGIVSFHAVSGAAPVSQSAAVLALCMEVRELSVTGQ